MKKFELEREKSGFLFIDIQDKLLKAVFNKEDVLKNNVILAKASEIMGMKNVITLQYPKGLGPMNQEIREPLGDSIELEKSYFSCMKDEAFKAEFEKQGIKQVIITGIETHICVFQTARDLVEAGYEVFIVSDAVGSRAKSDYKNALKNLRELGCVITTTETVLFDLLKKAGSDEFKKVQNLIK